MSAPDVRVQPGKALSDAELPRVAVVILNLNGRHHLQPCFESLQKSDYPEDKLRIVLVDNGSSDGSVEEMRAKHAWVDLVVNDHNKGFAGGCNQGAVEAEGAEILVFLNNDMRVEPEFLRELVGPVVRGECSATTGKMMSWDGKVLNSAGGGMNFHGIGIQRGYLEPPNPDYDAPMKTLFACGGAMAIQADVYADIGGFDDEFFAYYEDVDMGWRMWVLGHEVHYAPRAVCYHHHSSTSGRMPREMIRLLQVRNPIYACFKNYGDEAIGKVMPALLSLAVRRAFMASGLDPQDASFRIEKAEGPTAGAPQGAVRRIFRRARELGSETVPVRRSGVADLYAMNDFLGRFEYWQERRNEIQSRRKREDEEIFALFRKPEWCIEKDPAYAALQEGSLELYGVRDLFRGLTQPEPEPRG